MKRIILLVLVFACNTAEESELIHDRVSVKKFKEIIQEPDVQLVDVRTPGEYEGGYINNARNIDFKNPDFLTKCEQQLDKSKTVAIYCAKGGRSVKALALLKEAGFTKVYELEVGYNGYK